MFEAAYQSAWHHPGAAWTSALLVLATVAVLRGRAPIAILAGVLAVVSALDAWCSGSIAPPLAPGSAWYDRLAVVFVVAGDQRFFYAVARQLRARGEAFGISLALALVVPIASFGAQRLAPSLLPSPRALFLAYEVSFALVAIAARAWVRRCFTDASIRRWLTGLTSFELAQYTGWAAADVAILAGHDTGHLFRILPNVLYYGAFVPFLWVTAPAEARA